MKLLEDAQQELETEREARQSRSVTGLSFHGGLPVAGFPSLALTRLRDLTLSGVAVLLDSGYAGTTAFAARGRHVPEGLARQRFLGLVVAQKRVDDTSFGRDCRVVPSNRRSGGLYRGQTLVGESEQGESGHRVGDDRRADHDRSHEGIGATSRGARPCRDRTRCS